MQPKICILRLVEVRMILQVLLIQFNDSSIKVVENKCVSSQLIIMQLIDFNASHLFSTTFILTDD